MLFAFEAETAATNYPRNQIEREKTMIQMIHLLALSHSGFVERQVRSAIAGERWWRFGRRGG